VAVSAVVLRATGRMIMEGGGAGGEGEGQGGEEEDKCEGTRKGG